MSILFVVLVSAGVLMLFGICCEIANAVDRKTAKKLEGQLEKEEKNELGI
jgi:hypothetical protein